MTLILDMEGYKIEVEEKISGHKFKYYEGGYEQEVENTRAWVVRNGIRREVNDVHGLITAIERRAGDRWEEFAQREE